MAAASASPQQPSDSWDLPIVPPIERHRAPAVVQVPDNWDNDDESDTEGRNQRIWADANARTPNPMPTVILSPSATGPSHVTSPPPGAFQPTMRILKRPSNPCSSPTTPPPTVVSADSLKEREARYQAARERIFGSPEDTASSTSANASSPSLNSKSKREKERGVGPGVAVVRNLRGPAGGPENVIPKGFGGQRVLKTPLGSRTSLREDPVVG